MRNEKSPIPKLNVREQSELGFNTHTHKDLELLKSLHKPRASVMNVKCIMFAIDVEHQYTKIHTTKFRIEPK